MIVWRLLVRHGRWLRSRSVWFWLASMMALWAVVMAVTFHSIFDLQARRCESTLEARHETEQLWVGIAHDLGAGQETILAIHRNYDRLPKPADCEEGT